MAAALMKRCPGALVWFGTRTRRWWAFAMLRGAWTLLETQTVEWYRLKTHTGTRGGENW